MFECNAQSETMSRGETAEDFQCCTTACRAKTVPWGRNEDTNLLVQREAGQNLGFLHPEYVLSLQLCGVPLLVWMLLQSLSYAKEHENCSRSLSLQGEILNPLY